MTLSAWLGLAGHVWLTPSRGVHSFQERVGRFQLGFQLGKRHARLVGVGAVMRQSCAKLCALGIGDHGRGSLALCTFNQDSTRSDKPVRGCVRGCGQCLLGQLTLALQQQFDFGWRQSSRCGRGTELLIQ